MCIHLLTSGLSGGSNDTPTVGSGIEQVRPLSPDHAALTAARGLVGLTTAKPNHHRYRITRSPKVNANGLIIVENVQFCKEILLL